jgi:hypothetical protein
MIDKRSRRAEWNEFERYELSIGTERKELRLREETLLPMPGISSSGGMKMVEADPCRLPLPLPLALPLLHWEGIVPID